MEKENNTARNFVLQLGSLITLYLSVGFLIMLLYAIINLQFPDATENYWQIEQAGESVRFAFAMLVVFFPTYLVLTRKVNNIRRKEEDRTHHGLAKWLIYLSLLVGGVVLLGDLVAVIYNFLEGELTTRFLLKALVILVVVGSVFYYYLQDVKGYWMSEEKKSVTYGAVMTVVVVASLVLGLFYTETPSEVRELKLDEKQLTDLQDIQWQIDNYIRLNENLPESLSDIDSIKIPTAPEDREDYSYQMTDNGFELCATFAQPSNESLTSIARPIYPDVGAVIVNPNDWDHDAGRVCFERRVDLENLNNTNIPLPVN